MLNDRLIELAVFQNNIQSEKGLCSLYLKDCNTELITHNIYSYFQIEKDSNYSNEFDLIYLNYKDDMNSYDKEIFILMIISFGNYLNAEKQNNLGLMYLHGCNVECDYEKAAQCFLDSAKQKHHKAQCNLGLMYLNGKGLQQYYKEAFYWISLSANQDYCKAQYNLGLMYSCGKGLNKDYNESFKWYSLSANQGYSKAQCCLGFMYLFGEGIQQDFQKALSLFQLSADQGNSVAQSLLSLISYHFEGIFKNNNS